jgi:hypothetical protein
MPRAVRSQGQTLAENIPGVEGMTTGTTTTRRRARARRRHATRASSSVTTGSVSGSVSGVAGRGLARFTPAQAINAFANVRALRQGLTQQQWNSLYNILG